MIRQVLLENSDLRVRRCRHGPTLYSLHDIFMGRSLDYHGEYGERVVALYRQLVKTGHTVVDAGANIGCFTIFFGQQVGPTGCGSRL
jgi:hypothetical protein